MKQVKPMLFAMENSIKLGKQISSNLKIPLTEMKKIVFSDGETLISSEDTVRNKDVYVVASTCPPVHDNLMELLIFIDSLKRASAKTITIVLSYYGYARQDRKTAGRQPITAKLVANLLETAGATKIVAVDLHNKSIQGFFNIPVDDLRGQYIMAPKLKKLGSKYTVVSPDHGGAKRARLLAELISNTVQIAIVDKRRSGTNKTEAYGVLGNVKNKNVILVDDMIDTGGTIIKAAKMTKKLGAKKVIITVTHGIFSKGFAKFEKEEAIDKIWVTDTISSVHDIKSEKLVIISLGDLLAKSIQATMNSESISEMYESIKKKIG